MNSRWGSAVSTGMRLGLAAAIKKAPFPHLLKIRVCVLLTTILCGCVPNCSAIEIHHFARMIHTSWTAQAGAPQGITALAQGPDGMLWIGSSGGLFRFDGIGFNSFQPRSSQGDTPIAKVESLFVSKDGALWAAMYGDGIARIDDGRITRYSEADGLRLNHVYDFQQAGDGSLWALASSRFLSENGVPIRLGNDGIWHQQRSPDGKFSPHISGLLFDSFGTEWVIYRGHLFRCPARCTRFDQMKVRLVQPYRIAETSDHTLWVFELASGMYREEVLRLDLNGRFRGKTEIPGYASSTLSTPDGSLWLAIVEGGLWRINSPDPSNRRMHAAPHLEHFGQIDGLSSDAIYALLRDSDGNVWTAGLRGVDRFKPARLERLFQRAPLDGWCLCNDKQGHIWISNVQHQLFSVRDGILGRVQAPWTIYGLSCGTGQNLWLVTWQGIWKYSSGKWYSVSMMPGSQPGSTNQIVETSKHMLLASEDSSLAAHWVRKGAGWFRVSVPGLPSEPPLLQFVDSEDRVWTAYASGNIGVLQNGLHSFTSLSSTGLGVIGAFLECTHGFFAAGAEGLGVLQGETFRRLSFSDEMSIRGITGLVEAHNGDLWLNGARGIVRIPSEQIRFALATPGYKIPSESVVEGDFVGPAPLRDAGSSAAIDSHGKLWFVTLSGIVSLDPEKVDSKLKPPTLSIRSIGADGRGLDTAGRFPANPQAVQIAYFGVNLTAPERVIYRYKLDGFDEQWEQATSRAEVRYTALRPGRYMFHVETSTGDGVWSAPISTAFTILPAFYQTVWFAVTCAFMGVLLVWLVIAVRVQYAATRIRERADERAEERIRIARELHDTLLQGVQGLLLSFHAAAQKISPNDTSRKMLDRALLIADNLIIEGRTRVSRLRTERMTEEEFFASLENAGADLNVAGLVNYHLIRHGITIALQPFVAEEILFIAREALTNAFRHSDAQNIDLKLMYGKRTFEMSCKDDGCGFDVSRQEHAFGTGHWGLRGMAERAEGIGARFHCESSDQGGTQVVITLPAKRAYLGRKG